VQSREWRLGMGLGLVVGMGIRVFCGNGTWHAIETSALWWWNIPSRGGAIEIARPFEDLWRSHGVRNKIIKFPESTHQNAIMPYVPPGNKAWVNMWYKFIYEGYIYLIDIFWNIFTNSHQNVIMPYIPPGNWTWRDFFPYRYILECIIFILIHF